MKEKIKRVTEFIREHWKDALWAVLFFVLGAVVEKFINNSRVKTYSYAEMFNTEYREENEMGDNLCAFAIRMDVKGDKLQKSGAEFVFATPEYAKTNAVLVTNGVERHDNRDFINEAYNKCIK